MRTSRAMAFNKLRESMLSAASFLDATATRTKSGDIRIAEIVSRCEDLAATLRKSEAEISESYFAAISETAD